MGRVYEVYIYCRCGAVQNCCRLIKLQPFVSSQPSSRPAAQKECRIDVAARGSSICSFSCVQQCDMVFFRACLSLIRAVKSSSGIIFARCHSGVSIQCSFMHFCKDSPAGIINVAAGGRIECSVLVPSHSCCSHTFAVMLDY